MKNSNRLAAITHWLKTKNALDIVLYTLLIAALSSLIHLYWGLNDNMDGWEEFKAQHHCVLGRTESGTQQATWKCDDGNTYYRWRQLR